MANAQVQEVFEVSVVASSEKESSAAAKQEIFENAVESISVQYVKEIMGETKFEKNRDTVKNKIIKNSGKYVLFMKGGEPRKAGNRTEMDVTLKISLKSLEALLLNEGLLYKLEGLPKALPMISVIDRVNSKTYSWWNAPQDEKGFLVTQLDDFHVKIREQMRSRGFYALNPVFAPYQMLTPEVFHADSPPTEDYLFLGEFYQAQIVLRGYIMLRPAEASETYKLEVKIVAMHSGNGRIVGEVIRSYETETGNFQKVVKDKIAEVSEQVAQDLAVQLHDAWKSGTFGASLIHLAFIGDLDYQQLSQLKKLVLTQVKDVKTLKERYFAPGRVVFEVDSSVNSRQLAENFKAKSFPRFQMDVAEVRADGFDIRIKAQ